MAVSTIDPNGLNVGQLGGDKNIIINGAMECSQRGNYSSAVSLSDDTYYLDRWVSDLAGVSATIQNVSNGYLSKIKTQKLTATSSATGRLVSIQKIEVSGYMLGVELTASAQVKSNSSDARLFLVDNTNGTVLGVQAHTGGGAFEKLTVSGTPPTTCTDLRVYVALRGAAQENVAITSGDYFEFTEVQLEIGSTPTSYQHESYGTTLQKCLRFFEVVDLYEMVSTYIGSGKNQHYLTLFYKETKRASPTIGSVSIGNYQPGGGSGTAQLEGNALSTHCRVATGSTNSSIPVQIINSPSANMTIDAEL